MFDGIYTTDVHDMLYPELWDGCIGAWHPGLGPTGTMLYDWSMERTGTITNSTAAAAWTRVNGEWYFIGNGTNSYVDISRVDTALTGLSRCTMCFWVRRVASQNSAVMRGTQSSARFGVLWFLDNFIYACCESTTASFVTFASSATGLVHVSMIYDGSLSGAAKIRVAINGIDLAASGSNNPSSIPSQLASPSGVGMSIGADRSTSGGIYSPHAYTGIRIYNRVCTNDELILLAQRPGIEFTPRGRTLLDVGTTFNPAWAARCNQYVGLGAI